MSPLDPADPVSQRLAKLTDGAQSFEAMMLGQMLKPLRFGGSPGASDDDGNTDAGADTTRGMGTEALARAIASGGGFGIARQIIRQVTSEDATKGVGSERSKV
jgi:Rod binding domain-containing protein